MLLNTEHLLDYAGIMEGKTFYENLLKKLSNVIKNQHSIFGK